MPQRIAETVLRYKTDTASVQQAQQTNAAVAASFASIEEAARALNLSQAQIAQLNAQIGTTASVQTAELTKQTYLADRLVEAAKARQSAEAGFLADLRQEAFTGAAGGGGSSTQGIQSALFRARQAAIALPGVGFQSPITLALQGAGTLAGLGPAGLAAAAGIAAVGGGLLILSKNSEEARKHIKEAADAFLDVSEASATQTRAQLEQQRKDLLDLLAIQQENADAANAAVQARRRQVGSYADIPGLGALFEPTLAGLRDVADDANTRLAETQQKVNALNIQLAGTGDTAGDTAARFADLQKRLEDNLKLLEERQTAIQLSDLQNQVDAQRKTREEREAEIAALSEYLVVAQQFIDTTNLTEDAHRQIAIAMDDARSRMEDMESATYSFADAAANYALKVQQLQDQFDLYSDAIAKEGEISEKIIQIEQDLAQARADASEKLGDIARKGEERRDEIIADAADRRIEIEQKTQDAIARILRDAGRDQYQAVAERDSRAFVLSQQRAADQLEDQKKQEEQQLTQQEKAQAKQLASLQRSQDEQIRSVQRALQHETDIKNQALEYQKAALFKAQYDLAQIALYGSNNQLQIANYYWQENNRIAVTWAANTVNTISSIFSGLARSITGNGGIGAALGLPSPALNNAIDARIAQTIGIGAPRGYQATPL